MATHLSMGVSHFSNSSCTEADMDAWLDFSANNSPLPSVPPMAKAQQPTSASSSMTSPQNAVLSLDQQDDLQTPAKPSHEYSRFKQQTGLPSNSVPGLQSGSYTNLNPNSGTGLDEMSLMSGSGLDNWANDLSGLDMDLSSMPGNNMPQYFYPLASSQSPSGDDSMDSSDIPEGMPQNQRYFPGIHQQQRAAMAAKAQAQAQHQRRQQQQQQQQMLQNARQVAADQQGRVQQARRLTPSEAHAEETIARVVNQIRQNSQLASNDGNSNMLPHIIRAKKEEEDMDEDERLLASEEGKKLSSKERRQLRNKVSARAFRSRRKEYIGQLEGEVAAKSEECNDLKMQNRALMEENARSRALIEKLLRHPAFTPFLEDISRDEALKPQQITTETSAISREASSTASPFGSSQIPYTEAPAEETFHVGMTMIPETPLDISSLNLNNSSWNLPLNYSQPRVFAVVEVPEGPSDPINIEALSGKGSMPLVPQLSSVEEPSKVDYPVVERRPVGSQPKETSTDFTAATEGEAAFDSNPDFSLYCNTAAPVKSTTEPIAPRIESTKSTYFELVVVSTDNRQESLERMCALADASFQRIVDMTAQL